MDRLPNAFLKERLKLLDEQIERFPVIRCGMHRGIPVVREYYYEGDKRKRRQLAVNCEQARRLLSLIEQKEKLIRYRNRVESAIGDFTSTLKIDRRLVSTIYNKEYWESLKERLEDVPNHYNYKGYKMRSRGEVIIAQVLDSLGLEYKYEPMIIIDDTVYYPDFAVWLPEFGRLFFIEFMGRLDDKSYIYKNTPKLMNYLNSGMVINRDLLVFCGMQNTMVSVEEVVEDIISLINKYCRMYSVTPDRSGIPRVEV